MSVLANDADKPGPPEAPTISDVHKVGCTVSWQPPKEDGGTPITGYHVERHLTTSDRWLKVNTGAVTELTYKVNDLVEGSEYEFRVSAENKVGVGPPSSPSKPFVAKDPFSKYERIPLGFDLLCFVWYFMLKCWRNISRLALSGFRCIVCFFCERL
jgi:hypothetical protein